MYVVRRSSQTSDERDLSHNTRARSLPGVFSRACSKTSTCAFCRVDACHVRVETRETALETRRARGRFGDGEYSGQSVARRVASRRRATGRRRRETKKTEKTPKKTHPSSLSPLDVQSALTDAAAVSRDDSVDVCRRITAKVRAAPRPRDRRSEKKTKDAKREKNQTRRSPRTLFTSGRWS